MPLLDIVVRIVGEIRAALMGSAGSPTGLVGATAGDVAAAYLQLADRLDAAVARDRDEAASFWTKFLQGLENPFDYARHRAEFEAKGEGNVDAARQWLARVQEHVEKARAHAEVPGELEAAAAVWAEKALGVRQLGSSITRLQHLPGWQGPSAGEYGQVSVVQANATSELGGVAEAMSQALSALASLNQASFRLATDLINGARDQIPLAAAGGGYFYTRSHRAAAVLAQLENNLSAINKATVINPAVTELNGEVTSTLNAPALLSPGAWPAGGAAASVAPVEPNLVTVPDYVPTVQSGLDRCEAVPGVER